MQPGSSPRNLPEVFADQHRAEWDFSDGAQRPLASFYEGDIHREGHAGLLKHPAALTQHPLLRCAGVRRIIRLDIDAKLYCCWMCLEAAPANSSACAVLDDAAPA
jgi:hypothetical protein